MNLLGLMRQRDSQRNLKRRPGMNRSSQNSVATYHYSNQPLLLHAIDIRPSGGLVTKPHGGLWVTPVGASISWLDWCKESDYHCGKYRYILDIDTTNILTISDQGDVDAFDGVEIDHRFALQYFMADFVALKQKGVDGVWITDDAIDGPPLFPKLFYTWDCDSIVLLNERCIIAIRPDPTWRPL